MKNLNYFFLILIISFFFSFLTCNKKESKSPDIIQKGVIEQYKNPVDSINKTLKWKELKCGLWINKNKEIGFKIKEGNREGIFIDNYITRLCCEDVSLASVIDTVTFEYLGSEFYKDKNDIYHYYSMLDGGNFSIHEEADYKTFKVLNNCYAKDKSHIFGERAGILKNVDYKTFKASEKTGCFAKDKKGYYFWGDLMEEKEIEEFKKNEESKKILEELDRL